MIYIQITAPVSFLTRTVSQYSVPKKLFYHFSHHLLRFFAVVKHPYPSAVMPYSKNTISGAVLGLLYGDAFRVDS